MSGITGLATTGINSIAGVLTQWTDAGIFDYVLPFLLIFAVVYGILSKINILGEKDKNKGVNAVISIAIGLMALQWNLVPQFFSTIFPYTGIGISVLLVALILMGLFGFGFSEDGKIVDAWVVYTFFGLGAIIALVVIFNSFSGLGSFGGYAWWDQYGSSLVTLIIIAVLIGVITGGSSGSKSKKKKIETE